MIAAYDERLIGVFRDERSRRDSRAFRRRWWQRNFVVILGGFLDPIELVRRSLISGALQVRTDESRLIHIDNRGHGESEKPHEVEAYVMPLENSRGMSRCVETRGSGFNLLWVRRGCRAH